MHHLLDRDALEQDTMAAHSLYIAAVARAESVRYKVRCAAPGVTERDLLIARNERDLRFFMLRELLDVLGYVPQGLTARLPPEPGTDV